MREELKAENIFLKKQIEICHRHSPALCMENRKTKTRERAGVVNTHTHTHTQLSDRVHFFIYIYIYKRPSGNRLLRGYLFLCTLENRVAGVVSTAVQRSGILSRRQQWPSKFRVLAHGVNNDPPICSGHSFCDKFWPG